MNGDDEFFQFILETLESGLWTLAAHAAHAASLAAHVRMSETTYYTLVEFEMRNESLTPTVSYT